MLSICYIVALAGKVVGRGARTPDWVYENAGVVKESVHMASVAGTAIGGSAVA